MTFYGYLSKMAQENPLPHRIRGGDHVDGAKEVLADNIVSSSFHAEDFLTACFGIMYRNNSFGYDPGPYYFPREVVDLMASWGSLCDSITEDTRKFQAETPDFYFVGSLPSLGRQTSRNEWATAWGNFEVEPSENEC